VARNDDAQDVIDEINNVPLTCELTFTRTWTMTVTAKNPGDAEAILKRLVDEQNVDSPPEPLTVGSILSVRPQW
jgi:hypothetical protein